MDNYDNEIEQLLDKIGSQGFAEALERICYEKAEHVRSNWQDEGLAKAWEKNARAFGRCANQTTN